MEVGEGSQFRRRRTWAQDAREEEEEAEEEVPLIRWQAVQVEEVQVEQPSWGNDDYHPDVVDVGENLTYLYESQRHPFPHFIEPDVLLAIGGHGGGLGRDEGGGGRQMEVREGS